jgi:hypothetical protein
LPEAPREKEQTKDPHLDWMYAAEHVLKTYDWDLIENHAVQLLSRSLNIGRVTAFVGAGTSMAYGRISWKNLVLTELRKVRAKAAIVLGETQDAAAPDGRGAAFGATAADMQDDMASGAYAVRKLRATLQELNPAQPNGRPDRFPMIMQICEELDTQLNAEAVQRNRSGALQDEFRLSTRDRASLLTKDELGHAREIFWNACFGKSRDTVDRASSDGTALEKQIYGLNATSTAQARQTANSLFSRVGLDTFIAWVEPEIDALPVWTGAAAFVGHARRQLGDLLPPQRFVFETFLCWLPAGRRQELVKTSLDHLEPAGQSSQLPALKRSMVIPECRDPIRILHDDLQITRYMTTNYDSEIEAFFDDIGFASTLPDGSAHVAGQVSATRSRVSTFVSDKTTVGKFLAFVARPRSRSVHIVHLHGRSAAKMETTAKPASNIVFAEVDYQRRYLQDFPERDLEQGATRLAFGANPVLFIGSNMGEDDLLRSLREFMSSKEPFGERVCVALVPAMGHYDSCVEDKIALLGRYGVYAIHFGRARMPDADEEVLWLPWQRAVAGAAETALSKLRERFCGEQGGNETSQVLKKNDDVLVADLQSALRHAIEQNEKDGAWSRKGKVRYRLQAKFSTMEGIEISRHPGLCVSMELEMLDAIVDFVLSFDPGWAAGHAKAFDALCAGYLAAVRGLGDSILSAFSCAALLRLRQKWDTWREDWFKEPRYRDPRRITKLRVGRGKAQRSHLDGFVTLTHAIRVEHDHGSGGRSGRFFAGKTSRSLLGLIFALQGARNGAGDTAEDASDWVCRTGRRFLWLATRRGAGKGQFFSVFQACLAQLVPNETTVVLNEEGNAVRSILEALAPSQGNNGKDATIWGGVAFFNLAFAHDVMSVFDRLETFLRMTEPSQSAAQPVSGAEAANKNGRLAALREALDRFKTSEKTPKRVLVALNSMENLFDSMGRPKNSELKGLLDIITAPEYASVPIDFLFVVDDRAMGRGFCRNPVLLHFDGTDVTKCFQEKVQRDGFLNLPNASGQTTQGALGVGKATGQYSALPEHRESAREHAVFFIRTTPALLVLGAYFPRLAIFLLHAKVARLKDDDKTKIENYTVSPQMPANEDLTTFIGKTLSHYLGQFQPDKRWLSQERVWMQSVLAAVVIGLPEGARGAVDLPYRMALIDAAHFADAVNGAQSVFRLVPCSAQNISAWWRDIDRLGEALDETTRRLYAAVGRNRYLVTLVLAAASYFADSQFDETRPAPADVGAAAETFLRNICHEASAGGAMEKSNIVIEHVLRSYRFRQDGRLEKEDRPFSAGADGFNLCLEIIWHAAIVGRPVQASVLLACPKLRRHIEIAIAVAQSPADEKQSDKSKLDYLSASLQSCVERGFLFEIFPVGRVAGADTGADDGSERRYAVHHLMQRYIFKQMGGPNAEAIVGNQFAVSLFASQPDEMPSLDSAADKNIREVIASLTGYPDQDNLRSSMFHRASRVEASRMLRAAHGIMRSIYSVGVLARFDAVDPSSLLRVGVMEQYRRLVRWTLKATVNLTERPAPQLDTIEADPFHHDEVVWLYNEMGVLSLVQGRLADGDAMLNQALKLLREGNEPDGFGPCSNRIHVNKALLDIERGHFSPAQTVLNEICRLEDSDSVVRAVAIGYLGLTAHFSGNATEARRHYDIAVRALRRLGESRGCALFLRHWGDLVRAEGASGFDESERHLQEALRMAQRGRHEDVRHMAMLSLARLAIERGDPGRKRTIHPDLDEVERYAQITGMVRLGCEVALLRALMLMREGETRMASVECLRSLQIAAAYDMRLRTINATLLLSEICAARKLWTTAKELLDFASISARSLGDQSAVAASQRIKRLLPVG